ncbi:MAG: DUF4382 domain-containing protein [Halanaeroarchaeum sp.]
MDRRRDTERDPRRETSVDRRTLLAATGAVATTFVAGCSGGDTSNATGTFRLYISDQPVAIEEFDSLEVTIDGARLFKGDEETTTQAPTNSTTTNETATTTTTNGTANAETTGTTTDRSARTKGYVEIDDDGVTVDLTTVTGKKAVNVFEGGVPTGEYSSLALSVRDVGGVLDGEPVDVMLPSQRLRIVKPFEVRADEPVAFVFDITVVKKGRSGGYNLLPVVGESGVVGEHVEMRVVERERARDTGTTETTAQ